MKYYIRMFYFSMKFINVYFFYWNIEYHVLSLDTRLCVLIRQQRYCTRLCIGCMLDVCMRGLKQLRLNFHFHIRCFLFQSMFPALQYQQNFVLWIRGTDETSKVPTSIETYTDAVPIKLNWWIRMQMMNQYNSDKCRCRYLSVLLTFRQYHR